MIGGGEEHIEVGEPAVLIELARQDDGLQGSEVGHWARSRLITEVICKLKKDVQVINRTC